MQACIDPRMLSSSLASLLPTLSDLVRDHKSVKMVQPIHNICMAVASGLAGPVLAGPVLAPI